MNNPLSRTLVQPVPFWQQRSLTFMCVVALHALALAALLTIKMTAPTLDAAPVIAVQWAPTEQAAPPRPTPPPPVQPRKATPTPPVPQTVQRPQAVTATPLIQAATTEAPAPQEAPKPSPPPPVAAPVVAVAPQTVQATQPAATQTDPQRLRPDVDCIKSPKPRYPASLDGGERGTTVLAMRVDEKGYPMQIDTLQSSGHTALDRAARQALLLWQCPLRRDKQTISGWFSIPIVWIPPD